MDLKNKRVLVTGGSEGIGKSIIDELSQNDVTEIAVMGRTARKLDDLEQEYPSVNFLKLSGDVSKLEDIQRVSRKVKDEWGSLDILINNAGVVSAGLLDEISDEDIASMININLTGLILLTKYQLPMLKESNEGAIINISSGLGYLGMPFYSVYAATKAGVKHFSEAMRRELADYPIHVMTVFPTATDTPMMDTAKVNSEMDSPQKVAEATLEGLQNNEIEVILGGRQRLNQILKNFEQPLEVDKAVKEQFEALRTRAERHRSM